MGMGAVVLKNGKRIENVKKIKECCDRKTMKIVKESGEEEYIEKELIRRVVNVLDIPVQKNDGE